MRIVVVLGLAAAALAAALWLLVGSAGESEHGSNPDLERPQDGGLETGPTLTGGAGGRHAATAAAAARGRLVGRVTREGRPARAAIEARWRPGGHDDRVPAYAFGEWVERAGGLRAAADREPRATTASAEDGTFALDGVRVGVLEVEAAGEDGTRARAWVTLPEAGAVLQLDLALETPRSALHGQALTPDRRPVSGSAALLLATGDPLRGAWNAEAAFPLGTVLLADDGTFHFEGLVTGLVAVHLHLSDGTEALSLPVRLPRTEPLLVVVPALGASVRGTVLAVPGETPVGGALVSLSLPPQGIQAAWAASATTGLDGRFERPAPAAGLSLRVRAAGFADDERWLDASEREALVHLLRTARVEGRVLAKADHRPVAGAWVRLGEEVEREPSAVSDAEGRYVLARVRPGARCVFVLGGGWASPGLGSEGEERSEAQLTVLLPAGARVTHDLEVEPTAVTTVRVLDPDGKPVAGATARITAFEYGDDSSFLEGWTEVLSSPASDAEGLLALAGLPDGMSVHLEVTAPGFASVRCGPSPTGAGRPPLEVRLSRPRFVDVEVVLEDGGSPVAGATVTCRVAIGPGDESESYGPWFTDVAGRVRAGPLPPGPTVVRAATEGRRRATADAGEGRGPAGTPLSARVVIPRSLALRGRVLTPDGKPVFGASVRGQRAGRISVASQPTGLDGEFLLLVPSSDAYVLGAEAPGFQPSESREAEGGAQGVVLTLGAPARDERRRLVVRVLDPEGRPVPRFGATVQSGRSSSSREGGDGRTEFVVDDGAEGTITRGLARGDLWLFVHDAQGADALPLPLAPRVRRLTEADLTGIEVRLVPGPALEGRVVGPNGEPIRGVKVWAEAAEGEPEGPRWPTVAEGVTDAEGRFRLWGAAEGQNVVSVRPPRGFSGPREPPQGAPGGPSVEIPLRRAVTARVRVLGPDGSALEGAEVYAEREGDNVYADTGADGVATLIDLDPDARWKLMTSADGRSPRLPPVTIDPWVPADTEVRMSRGLTLTGRVVDAQGRPVAAARVWTVDAHDATQRSEQSASDGTFRLDGLPSGPLTLWAAPPGSPGDEHFFAAPLVVEGSREGLTLVVDRGTDVTVRIAGWTRGDLRIRPSLLHFDGSTWSSLATLEAPGADGRLSLRALRDGQRYALWTWDGEGHFAHAEIPVRAGEQVVPWQEGRAIEGRVVGLPPGDRPRVHATDDLGRWAWTEVKADGRYALAGLPPGTWRLEVGVDAQPGPRLEASASAAAGGTTDLALRPAAR